MLNTVDVRLEVQTFRTDSMFDVTSAELSSRLYERNALVPFLRNRQHCGASGLDSLSFRLPAEPEALPAILWAAGHGRLRLAG